MEYDPQNPVVKLCAEGMQLEGEGKPAAALALFETAWVKATNDHEKSIAAHYVARHQPGIPEKLRWDLLALNHALCCNNPLSKQSRPSLYLNVAKCQEDLGEKEAAITNYMLAHQHCDLLPEDGYGNMIRQGIESALRRMRG